MLDNTNEQIHNYSKELTIVLIEAAREYFDGKGAEANKLKGHDQSLVYNMAMVNIRLNPMIGIMKSNKVPKDKFLVMLKKTEENYSDMFAFVLSNILKDHYKSLG